MELSEGAVEAGCWVGGAAALTRVAVVVGGVSGEWRAAGYGHLRASEGGESVCSTSERASAQNYVATFAVAVVVIVAHVEKGV